MTDERRKGMQELSDRILTIEIDMKNHIERSTNHIKEVKESLKEIQATINKITITATIIDGFGERLNQHFEDDDKRFSAIDGRIKFYAGIVGGTQVIGFLGVLFAIIKH